jgi:uncharacterized protein (TIGR01777 family)
VGSALKAALIARGDEVRVLSREGGAGRFEWAPMAGRMDSRALAGCDAVIHLAGRKVLTPWTRTAKRAIWSSRVRGGQLLAEAIASMPDPPGTFITASAVGFYGHRGGERLSETSAVGAGFLAELCAAWEAAAAPAERAGVRIAAVRTGLVLQSLIAPLRLPFSLALGARLGNGQQWMSWIRLEDLVAGFLHILDRSDLAGPFNAVAPEPVTNTAFTRLLARALHRPAVLVAPAFALRRLAGREFADETLLASQRAIPERLLASGFTFQWPQLEPALEDLVRG